MITEQEIFNLNWKNIDVNYYGLKTFDDFSRQDGFEYRLSVFPKNIMIQCFPISYGVSAADDTNNDDCNIIFKGRIDDGKCLETLMNWLEMPIKNLEHNYRIV